MSFIRKLFGGKVSCNRCGHPDARDGFAGIKCPSPGCPNYTVAPRNTSQFIGPSAVAIKNSSTSVPDFRIEKPIELNYLNHANQSRRIVGDCESILDRGKFISLLVAPKGVRISLRKDRISGVSPSVIAAAIKESENGPSAKEAHILRYHKAMGTTSRRFEELQRKYPNFLG